MKKSEIKIGSSYTNGKGSIRKVIDAGEQFSLYPGQAETDNIRYLLVSRNIKTGNGSNVVGQEYNCTRVSFATWAKETTMAEITKEWEAYKNNQGNWVVRADYTEVARLIDENPEANARLIVAAHNACASVNPSNPLAVAESIKETFTALNGVRLLAQGYTKMPKDLILKTIEPILAKVSRVASQKEG